MPFPLGWGVVPPNLGPRVASGRRSIRFFATGTGTINFADNAFLFSQPVLLPAAVANATPNTFTPLPQVGPVPGTPREQQIVTVPPTPQGTGTTDVGSPVPMIWAFGIRVTNAAGLLDISFDGVNVHGQVGVESVTYLFRHEAGISVRNGGAFRIEAW